MTTWHHYNNPDYNEKRCCANCIHLYDESSITACMLLDWMKVEFDDCCDEFNKGEENV